MSSPSARRRALRIWTPVALVGALLSSGLVTPVAAAPATDVEWVVPVPGGVVSPFREPASRYAAGHRGVDFAAPPGTQVKAANDGQVVFAGTVAGALHVVVGHDGGIRTSYSFLASVTVAQGQRVRRGQIVGTAGGSGAGHGPGVLHFGVRIGERYVDPMLLFRPPDLTEMVRLVPAAERAAADVAEMTRAEAEQRAKEMLEESFGHGLLDDALAGLGDAVDWVGSTAQRAFDAGVEFAEGLGGGIGEWIRDRYDEISAAAAALAEGVVEVVEAVGQAIVDVAEALVELGEQLLEELLSCPQPDARSVRDQPGTHHLAIAVGGRDSSRRRRDDGSFAPSFDFHWRELGFERGHVSFFSYSEAETYDKADTYGDLHREARDLGRQIKARGAASPGTPVDLFGHSQGGVVIALFLQEVYRGHEHEYPPIENVVTYASPLQGTPAANLGVSVGRTALGGVALGGQGLDSRALEQLCQGSPTIEGLWERPLPSSVRFLSIGGMSDPVVPSTSTEAPGATGIVVAVGGVSPFDDHSGIVADDDAISATQAHLRGEAVGGCGMLAGAVGSTVATVVRTASVAASTVETQSEGELPRAPSIRDGRPIVRGVRSRILERVAPTLLVLVALVALGAPAPRAEGLGRTDAVEPLWHVVATPDARYVGADERGSVVTGLSGGIVVTDPIGGPVWSGSVTTGDERVLSPPAVSATIVFVPIERSRAVAIDRASGRALWAEPIADIVAVGTSASGDVVSVVSRTRVELREGASGALRWAFDLPVDRTIPEILAAPLRVSVSASVVVVAWTDSKSHVQVHDRLDGRVLWVREHDLISAAPAVSDRAVFLAENDHPTAGETDMVSTILRLDLMTGAVEWRRRVRGIFLPGFVGDADGRIVVVIDLRGRVFALEATNGRVRWRRATGARQYTNEVHAVGDVVAFTTLGTGLVVLDRRDGAPVANQSPGRAQPWSIIRASAATGAQLYLLTHPNGGSGQAAVLVMLPTGPDGWAPGHELDTRPEE